MPNKHPEAMSGLGSALKGAAALILALLAVAAFLSSKNNGRADQSGSNLVTRGEFNSDMAGRRVQEVASHGGISLLDVQAARVAMAAARDAAIKNSCNTVQLEAFARADLTLESADADRDAGRYASAVDGYRRAAELYRDCYAR